MICDPGGANQAPGDDSSAILSVNMTEADQNTGTIPEDVSGFPGRYWHALEDGRIQCDLCPRLCKLNEGQRGLCFVRARTDDQIVLTTYGRSSGYCIDPIEKKPLNHFLPGTPVLSFGAAGCNLTCKFCQN
jgi:pyruvate formate lyase activating enzyme